MKKLIIASMIAVLAAPISCSKNPDNAIVAKVNRTRITAGDLKRQLAGLSPDALQRIVNDDAARKEVMDDVIAYELVLQEARKQGLDDAEFTKRRETRRKEVERRLQEDAKNELVTALLKKELGDKLSVSVSDAEVKEFYEKNRAKMVTAEGKKVRLSEVAALIKERLVSMKQRDAYMDYANKLRDNAKITINDNALQNVADSLAKSDEKDVSVPRLPSPGQPTGKEGKSVGK